MSEADVVIRAEGLGKKYVIGHQSPERYTALRDVIALQARALGRSVMDIVRGRPNIAEDELEELWALRNIDFEIRRGDVVGIIGQNGSGKSTLLKVLSRITEPTEGRVTIDGRIASLLEVGTGFHPELTGRENVYLNGAILGMTNVEIKRKFDEIIDFAGVERFLDTPVKRYSSGMYVRLAFSVAAHLEPEILVVDEVLAVGDSEFQKKCLGKMHDVSEQGRTVLFVSHNMAAVQSLCGTAFLLSKGKLECFGQTADVISEYLRAPETDLLSELDLRAHARSGEGSVRFEEMVIRDDSGGVETAPKTGAPCSIVLKLSGSMDRIGRARVRVLIGDTYGNSLIMLANEASLERSLSVGPGDSVVCRIDRLPLSQGTYRVSLYLAVNGVMQDYIEDGISISVLDGAFYETVRNVPKGWDGKTVLVDNRWIVERDAEARHNAGE